MTADIDLSLAELEPILAGFARLQRVLERLREASVQNEVSHLPACDAPPSEHRRLHRPGNRPKLDADPVLQAFVLDRIDRLTFKSIAAEVAEYFPPERRVGRSAIYEWSRRRRVRGADSPGLPG